MNPRRTLALHLLFGMANLAFAAPVVYLLLGLPMVMRQQGWTGVEIGMFQLAALPAIAKPLLALPVEWLGRHQSHYKRWTLALGVAYVAVLLGLAGQGPASGSTLFALAVATAWCATWIDVPLNALAIKLLPPSEHMRAGGVRSAALFAGGIVGAGVMVLLQTRQGWAMPFQVMAALLAAVVALSALLPETVAPQAAGPGQTSTRLPWREFLRRPGAKPWSLLLLVYFPFVGAAWVYLKPLLIDQGMPAEQIAAVVGIGGGVIGAAASIATGRLAQKISVLRLLPFGALINLCALAALAAMLHFGAARGFLIAGALLLAAAVGVTAALAFGLINQFARPSLAAADYGAQAGAFSISRLAVLPLAGLALDAFGHVGLMSLLAGAALGVFGLTIALSRRLRLAVG